MIPQCGQAILMEIRCGCVIICLLRKWLRLELLKRIIARTIPKAPTDREQATNQELLTKQAIEDKQLIHKQSDCNKTSNSSKNSRITTDLTKEQLTKHKNKYEYRQRSEVCDLDYRLKVWNKLGARSQPWRPWNLRNLEGWCRKIKSWVIPDSIY